VGGYIILDPEDNTGAYKISGGQNGSWQFLVKSMLYLFAGLSGYLDGHSQCKIGGMNCRPPMEWLSQKMKSVAKLGTIAKWLGGVGLLVSIALIFFDEKLSTSQKIGQILMNVLGFAITSVFSAGMVIAMPAFPIIVGVMVAIMSLFIALTIAVLNDMYLSSVRFINNWHRYV
jgi:hypothetical protein